MPPLLPGAEQIRYLSDLFESIQWWRLVPTPELLTTQPGEHDHSLFITAAKSAENDLIVVYTPREREFTLNMNGLPDDLSAMWFDPRSGARQSAALNSGHFVTPAEGDWVLVLGRSISLTRRLRRIFMKVLIISGTGLISTPLTHFLLERGDDVTLYNRRETPVHVPEKTRMLHGNRQDYAAFENQMREAGHFDCVIDMVGYDPGDGESVVRAFKGRVGHFIFCSTVDVYKKPATRYPYTEAETYGGLNAYASNKVIIEKGLLQAHASDFPVTIIRPAYTYGESRRVLYPVDSSGGYFDRIRQGKPIIVHGDGSSLWVACHIDDVARAFINAVGNPRTFGKSYHTTGEEWMTWDMYHQGVAEALGAPHDLCSYPYRYAG